MTPSVAYPFCSTCGKTLPGRPPVRCPACGVTHYANAKPCAGVLIMQDGRLLLLRRAIEPWRGMWDIPGGFCDPEEHPMLTAQREAREETGLDVDVTGFLGLWLDRYPDPSDPDADVTLNAYYHATVGAEVGAPDPAETTEIGWFSPDELPPIAFPNHAEAVLVAWRQAVKDGRTVTPLPDRPGPAPA
ncbi:MAG TPA: NUDIX domain-containing protein [Acidimicrobiia bacterium]|nr:NUDIX domain-containing protein [Acidimicrobiia bacterium]